VIMVVAIVAALIGAFYPKFYPGTKSTKVVPDNPCAEAVFKKYLQAKATLTNEELREDTALQPTMDTFIENRRLEESFCMEFVACSPPEGDIKFRASLQSIAFEKCVEDEAKDDKETDDKDE
jgi:hypothetical protein